jgi:acyl transferase domain-containing protein/thioesterase domain-containing protein
VSGVLRLKDAVKLAAVRGQLIEDAPAGAMVAIEAEEGEVRPMLTAGVSIAAVNGPRSVVVSGDTGDVLALAGQWRERGRRTRRLEVGKAGHSHLMDDVLDELAEVAEELDYQPPHLAVVSTVTGTLVVEEMGTPQYWVDNCRQPVRFLDGMRTLAERGADRFVELGPGGVLLGLAQDCLTGDALMIPMLRKDRPDDQSAMLAAGALYAEGLGLDPARLFEGRNARRVPLPTYAFQRRRYWPDVDMDAVRGAGGGAAAVPLAGHPFAAAPIALAGSDSVVLTGLVSVRTEPWLADHALDTTVIFPGAAFVELVIRAGDEVGCGRVDELTLETPLVLPERGKVRLQTVIGPPDASGSRPVSVYSRPDDADPATLWTRHAAGRVAPATGDEEAELTDWPPAGAEPVPVEGMYEALAAAGLNYGPAFQGLRAAWRHGNAVFAEVDLTEPISGQADRFGLHPAMLDAALHAIGLTGVADGVPYAWSGVELLATGATALRVRVTPLGNGAASLRLADTVGQPVVSVESLVLRPAPDAWRPTAAGSAELLFALRWQPVPLKAEPATGRWETVPAAELEALPAGDVDVVVLDVTGSGDLTATTGTVLAAVQRWLWRAELTASTLLVLTHSAVGLDGEDVTDLSAAAVWGLLRSAQSEHPGRILLADIDDHPDSLRLLPAVVSRAASQVVVRRGVAHEPRLTRAAAAGDGPAGRFGPDGTTLITGATGALGRLVARHLVAAHGVRRLVLVSRGGRAPDLVAELTELGAEVRMVACDVTDRDALSALIGSIPAEHPLRAVVHLAGGMHDGLVATCTPDQLAAALRPKAVGAWTLHELTESMDLSAFVLFSSANGLFGSPGQANYAAANTFLDALAAHRRAHGKPAQSLAWGLWSTFGAAISAMSETGKARLGRAGMPALSDAEGLALFDLATARPEALLAPMKLDLTGPGPVPDVLKALVPPARRIAARAGRTGPRSLWERLAGLPVELQEEELRRLVLEHAAMLLGHPDPGAIDPDRHFLESGFDSLLAVELRNSLNEATGLRLPATVAFDQQTPAGLAAHLRGELDADPSAAPTTDTLKQRFREAVERGNVHDGLGILSSAARLRSAFASSAELERVPVPILLAEGDSLPRLFCLSTPVAMGGVYQYARLATQLRGRRDVAVVPMPGFLPGERLPGSAAALIEILADTIRKAAGGDPFAVLGYSSAGVLAYATAACLEQSGDGPAAVVLLDTYPVSGDAALAVGEELMAEAIAGMFEREAQYGPFDHNKLTAMARYMELLPDCQLTDIAALTLLLRPQRPVGRASGGSEPGGWQSGWDRADTVRTIPGDHFSMIEDQSETTARAIQDWLAGLP